MGLSLTIVVGSFASNWAGCNRQLSRWLICHQIGQVEIKSLVIWIQISGHDGLHLNVRPGRVIVEFRS